MNHPMHQLRLPKDLVLPMDSKNNIPPYVLDQAIVVAIRVALATDRPLLVSGPPGCGKSTLARALAHYQGWGYLSHTLTSRSRLEDLTVDIDHLQRLHDAHAATANENRLLPEWAYRKPGLFWWAFDPDSARRFGVENEKLNERNISADRRPAYPSAHNIDAGVVIVLLDEIDKAEPDLPNDLLEPLDGGGFALPGGGRIEKPQERQLVVFITTNEERELPQAFQRRCLYLNLERPKELDLLRIAECHFTGTGEFDKRLAQVVAKAYLDIADYHERKRLRIPGTSEFLDALKACRELEVGAKNPVWELVQRIAIRKTSVEQRG